MGDKIKARRELMGQQSVFGLLDGDFVRDWNPPTGQPKQWSVGAGQVFLGWRWERKEIENYLIDPSVVSSSLGQNAPDGSAYAEALNRSRDRICTYEAARLALSLHRPRFQPMANAFGRERGGIGCVFPDDLGYQSCVDGIRQAVAEYNAGQVVEVHVVEAEFKARRTECEAGGLRYMHFLSAFAGKDLLVAMGPDLMNLGFSAPSVFLEKILRGIENSTEEVWSWLPEWTNLRQAINAI